MVAQQPRVAALDAGIGASRFPGGVEVERLRPVALLTDIKRAEQVLDLVLLEAREGEVDVLNRLKVI